MTTKTKEKRNTGKEKKKRNKGFPYKSRTSLNKIEGCVNDE